PGHDEWMAAGSAGGGRVGRLHVAGLPPEEAEEFYAYQFLFVASPTGQALPGRTESPGAESRPAHGIPFSRPATSPPPARPRMRFAQDFVADFDQFDFHGPPFAFVRFGDGERSICRGVPLVNCDGWSYDGRASRFAADLDASLTFSDPDYYVGISDGCCDR